MLVKIQNKNQRKKTQIPIEFLKNTIKNDHW